MIKFKSFFSYSHVIWLLVAGIFLNVAYILYLGLYPFRTVEIFNAPVPVTNSPVLAGSVVEYKVDYCRYTDKPAQVTRTLVGKTVTTLVDFTSTASKGCKTVTVANTIIPNYVMSGPYHLEINACFNTTPLQSRCTKYNTQNFQVVR